MSTTIYWHPDIFLHDQEAGHLLMVAHRLPQIYEAVITGTENPVKLAREATAVELQRVHDMDYLAKLAGSAALTAGQEFAFDRETKINRHTWRALLLSAGAVCQAVDDVHAGRTRNAFCIGYAGHHAEPAHAGGFCFTNQVAVAARHAIAQGMLRIAVLDFDTHSGNGTILSLFDEPRILFAETYQKGYPGSFLPGTRPAHILRKSCNSRADFRFGWSSLLEKVREYSPELVLVSAGFDAHKADPLGQVGIDDHDYLWLANEIAGLNSPVVATLEGGYSIPDVARCARLFVNELARAR